MIDTTCQPTGWGFTVNQLRNFIMRTIRRFLLLLALPALALARDTTSRPSLVIAIVVDQMRADFLPRYDDVYGEGGFARFRLHGAVFTNCRFGHAWTITGPGHSVVLSGVDPGRNGIVSNDWYDQKTKSYVNCVGDSTVSAVGIDRDDPAGKVSPRNFLASSLGDMLKKSSPSSKVLGMAIKDRAAVLPAGGNADAAYWFDARSGRWISSTYYMNCLPEWVEAFNARCLPENFLGKTWDKLLPEEAYTRCAPDSCPGEGTIPHDPGIVFPHFVRPPSGPGGRRYDAVLYTPWGNSMTAEFARAAITGEQLGQRGVTDILAISFSSTDYAGHVFGPDSHEIMDMYLRFDRELAGLFAFVDSAVGMNRVAVFLTGDHGVCPLPELHAARGAKRLNASDFMNHIRDEIGRRLGYDETSERLIVSGPSGFFDLDEEGIRRRGWSVPDYEKALAEVVRAQKDIARVITRSEVLASLAAGGSADTLQRSVERSFHPDRSGAVAVIPAPYCLFTRKTGTTHGSPFLYDKHVPLVMMGKGVTQGIYPRPCEPADIAPTLAAILGVRPPPGGSGRVLVEALGIRPPAIKGETPAP